MESYNIIEKREGVKEYVVGPENGYLIKIFNGDTVNHGDDGPARILVVID